MKTLLLLSLATISSVITCFGQNLVMNSSFEGVNFASCDISDDFDDILLDWDSPNAMAGDVYFTNIAQDCYTFQPNSTYSGPIGFKGSELPAEGLVFAGIWVYTIAGFEDREYARGTLSSPLEVGSTYRVKFKISLADYMESYVGELGIAFTETQQAQLNGNLVVDQPQLVFNSGLDVTDGWVTYDSTFVSDGNYEYFIIGNFNSDEETEIFANPGASGAVGTYGAYYYLDEVSVELETSSALIENSPTKIEVYPNPVVEHLNYNIAGSGLRSYSIINQLGQTIRTGSLNTTGVGRIDCVSLRPGIYYLTGCDADGNRISGVRFVKGL